MKLSLSENIRLFRKQRKLTQEKLAEALGVTVGAVYKWESGLSQPELSLLVEIADFFDTSVDVLLGYAKKDNRLDAVLNRLQEYCRTLDPAALPEADKLVGKYPHSFWAVYAGGCVYLTLGAGDHDRRKLRRALELLEQSIVLLPQAEDKSINETAINSNIATVLFLLGEQEKGVELLKKNNVNGVFSSLIGAYLAGFMNRPEEAKPYLQESLLDSISTLINTIFSYVFVFRSRRDWKSAMAITTWGLDTLSGVQAEAKEGILTKARAEMLILLAYAQSKAGLLAESRDSLSQAHALALHFDSMPDYSLQTTRFADLPNAIMGFDILGATASGSIEALLRLLDDPVLSEQWREMAESRVNPQEG